MRYCVKGTAARPKIFPARSSKGLTEAIRISTMRVDFSSRTERMVAIPYISRVAYRTVAMKIGNKKL